MDKKKYPYFIQKTFFFVTSPFFCVLISQEPDIIIYLRKA